MESVSTQNKEIETLKGENAKMKEKEVKLTMERDDMSNLVQELADQISQLNGEKKALKELVESLSLTAAKYEQSLEDGKQNEA